MGASDWLLVLPSTRGWDDYYASKLAMLDEARTVIWHYKLPWRPEAGFGMPTQHPRLTERIYLAHNKTIRGWVGNYGAEVSENTGFPVVGETDNQGPGPYIRLVGPFVDIAFVTTDPRKILSQVTGLPKGLPGLHRFVF